MSSYITPFCDMMMVVWPPFCVTNYPHSFNLSICNRMKDWDKAPSGFFQTFLFVETKKKKNMIGRGLVNPQKKNVFNKKVL